MSNPGISFNHRLRRTLAWLVAIGFIVLNVLAYRHAHAMLHYVPSGERPPKPEALSGLQKLRVLLAGIEIPRPENRETPGDRNLNSATCVIPVDGDLRLEAWHAPAGDALTRTRALVVLFHGYQASKDTLLTEAEQFHAMGCATLLVDFRGSGGSPGSATTLGWDEAADVTAAFRYARGLAGPDVPVILYGQSMGAAAILRAIAVDGIRPDGIVLESVFDRMLTTVGNRFRLMHAPAFPGAELLVFWGGAQGGFNGFRHNPATYARAVQVPALMLVGAQDARATPEQARRVYDALAGPKTIEEFQAGHASFAGSHPRKWQFVIDAFLPARVNSSD